MEVYAAFVSLAAFFFGLQWWCVRCDLRYEKSQRNYYQAAYNQALEVLGDTRKQVATRDGLIARIHEATKQF